MARTKNYNNSNISFLKNEEYKDYVGPTVH